MFLFVLFVSTVIYVFGKLLGFGTGYVVFGFVFAAAMSIGSYFYSDKIVLATMRAHQIKKSDNPQLFEIVEHLTKEDGLPMPKIYIVTDASPNAFATGRDPQHAVVCCTSGILQTLNKAELEGVLSHELSHVKNYDTRLMAIVAVLVGFVAIIANMFLNQMLFGGFRRSNNDSEGNNLQMVFLAIGLIFALLSPLVATIIQLAISRKRELLADASGTLLTKYPEGLAEALEKISADPKPLRGASNATAHLFIVNPFKGKSGRAWFAGLFDTHPPIEERIKILRSM